jgi:hypothetical protein
MHWFFTISPLSKQEVLSSKIAVLTASSIGVCFYYIQHPQIIVAYHCCYCASRGRHGQSLEYHDNEAHDSWNTRRNNKPAEVDR